MFYNLWQGAEQGVNDYKPFRVDWWDVPGRDEHWKLQTIANTSHYSLIKSLVIHSLVLVIHLLMPKHL